MYAIAEIQGKQFKIEQGKYIDVPHIKDSKEGDKIDIERIMMKADGETVNVGTPYIDGVKASATIQEALRKEKKVITIKYKRRKKSRTTRGERAQSSRIMIDSIG